ncbi:MAG: TolC family protein [Rhodanobacteraceae bacterium]|nr:TolC family protein [Rhodanobacteraceae bacterium]
MSIRETIKNFARPSAVPSLPRRLDALAQPAPVPADLRSSSLLTVEGTASRTAFFKAPRYLAASLLLAAAGANAATDLSFLPPEDIALRAIAAYPEVVAATAGTRRADAESRALAAGPHELTLSVIPQQRRVRNGPDYREFEGQLTRGVRLPGKARLDREIGRLGSEVAELQLADTEHQAARTLLTLWMDWLRAEGALAQATAQRTLLQQDRDAIARRVRAGDAAARDLDSADAALAQADAAATAAGARREAARIALAGTFPLIPLPERAPPLPEPAPDADSAATHIAHIIERSHEIGAAEREAERQDRSAERARADRIADPQVGLRWLDERGGEERVLGVVVSIPFGGAHRSAIADAQRASADASAAQAAGMRRTIAIEAEQTVRHADAAWRLWRDSQRALEATRASTAKSRRAYALGEAGIAELIAAQRLEQESALAELTARADALEAALRIRVDAHEMWHEGGVEGGG